MRFGRACVGFLAAATVCLPPLPADARSSRSSSGHYSQSPSPISSAHGRKQAGAGHGYLMGTATPRHSRGTIKRSEKARGDFKQSHPCPTTGRSSGSCPGYVIDHVTPLKRGGADAPYNMQWQTEAEAKRKDKWE